MNSSPWLERACSSVLCVVVTARAKIGLDGNFEKRA